MLLLSSHVRPATSILPFLHAQLLPIRTNPRRSLPTRRRACRHVHKQARRTEGGGESYMLRLHSSGAVASSISQELRRLAKCHYRPGGVRIHIEKAVEGGKADMAGVAKASAPAPAARGAQPAAPRARPRAPTPTRAANETTESSPSALLSKGLLSRLLWLPTLR